jgi:hypothetical protein
MKPSFPSRPRLLDALQGYGGRDFGSDLGAGLTVGVIALSLAMSLGIASLPPENQQAPAIGIYTAIIAGFLISALGGSRVQIGGPTAAFIPCRRGDIAGAGPGDDGRPKVEVAGGGGLIAISPSYVWPRGTNTWAGARGCVD